MGEVVLEARDVAKSFAQTSANLVAFASGLVGPDFGSALGRGLGATFHQAVEGCSFALNRSESIGLIGHNGAGKSTLLKMLAGISDPDRGDISISGRLASLIDLGVSFHPDLTGRENAKLAAAMRGVSPSQIERCTRESLVFAELESFADQPVRTYSSGMVVRLGFAIAVHSQPEILLLDEVLAVGDLAFQAKCMERINQMRTDGCAMMFVSHSMLQVEQVCERVLVLEKGRLIFDGPTSEGIRLYEQNILSPEAEDEDETVVARDVALRDAHGNDVSRVSRLQELHLQFSLSAVVSRSVNVVVGITRSDRVIACNYNYKLDNDEMLSLEGGVSVEVAFPPVLLNAGHYTLGLYIWNHDYTVQYYARDHLSFDVEDDFLRRHSGMFYQAARWSTQSLSS